MLNLETSYRCLTEIVSCAKNRELMFYPHDSFFLNEIVRNGFVRNLTHDVLLESQLGLHTSKMSELMFVEVENRNMSSTRNTLSVLCGIP